MFSLSMLLDQKLQPIGHNDWEDLSLDSRSTFSTNFRENAHFTIIAVVVVVDIVFALNKT